MTTADLQKRSKLADSAINEIRNANNRRNQRLTLENLGHVSISVGRQSGVSNDTR